jgi:hypothetical protein
MNRQTNLILSAAVAAAFGATAMSAHAGVASALPAKIATAALKNNAQEFKGNQLTYSTQVPLSALTVYYVYVKLLTGTFSTAPTAALFSSNNAVLQTSLQNSTAAALSSDGSFAVYTLQSTTTVVPVNVTISFTPTNVTATFGAVEGLTSLLAGGNVNEQISIGSSANTTSVLADIDSAAGGNIITFTAPQTYAAYSSGVSPGTFTNLNVGGTGPETTMINVAQGTGVSLTSTAMTGGTQTIDFGGFVLTDVGGVLDASQASSWTISNEYTGGALSATVTGNFAAASSMYLSSTANCSVSDNTLTLNTAKTSATLAAGTLLGTGGIGQVVCMITNGTTTIPSTTPTISITTSSTGTSQDQGAPLSYGPSTLYALTPNGGTVVIRAYLPQASGFLDVVRIINNGQVGSSVTVARIDPVTGAIGNSGVLAGGTLAAGGAANYTSAAIEAALGGPLAAGDRPRLLFTANTTIEGQNYIINPDGTVTTLHGVDQGSVP